MKTLTLVSINSISLCKVNTTEKEPSREHRSDWLDWGNTAARVSRPPFRPDHLA